GQYERAETLLKRAIGEGLNDHHDVAVAQKHLAFIACAYNRPADCEQAFRAAFSADPSFKLSESEIGHPLWGPVYKRVASEQAAAPPGKTPPASKEAERPRSTVGIRRPLVTADPEAAPLEADPRSARDAVLDDVFELHFTATGKL